MFWCGVLVIVVDVSAPLAGQEDLQSSIGITAQLTTILTRRDAEQQVVEAGQDVLDAERVAGTVRGDMHGIPVLLKDNIATGDEMHTTAGAAAMLDWDPSRDAFLVSQLREAGAVILGKANLSEWAGWIYPEPETAGFSALGGFPVNPYDPSLPVLGSSSGSAVGTSANLVAASVGTETAGSLIAPSSASTRRITGLGAT